MARTDQLTGLGNRAALEDQLAAMRSVIDRAGVRYAVLLLDLDRFKLINDELGHSAGDDVLRRVSRGMRGAMRAGDGAFRFGGEEFIAIVHLAEGDDAFAAAERVRRVIERIAIAHPSNPPFGVVTASVGGCVVDRARLEEPPDAWFASADRALYEAKRLGRNRSVVI
jgi:diguanylate cyclase